MSKISTKTKYREPAYTSHSWGIRKLPDVRWIVDIYEHTFDADHKYISTTVIKSSDPLSMTYALGTWKLWAAEEVSKLK